MAIEPATDTAHATGNADAQDINVHVRDYSGFTRLFKWSAVAAFVIGFIVVLIISS